MTLLDAIDALVAHVPDDQVVEYGSERRTRFDDLDRAVWVEASKLGLDGKLPPGPGLGLTHLPGEPMISGDFVPMGVGWWRNRMLALRALAEQRKSQTTKTGRPRKREATGPALVLAALVKYHGWDNGSVNDRPPASLAELSKLCGKTKTTVSNFLADKFGDDQYKRYEAACVGRKIGILLSKWQGELPERLAGLFEEEYGRGRDGE